VRDRRELLVLAGAVAEEHEEGRRIVGEEPEVCAETGFDLGVGTVGDRRGVGDGVAQPAADVAQELEVQLALRRSAGRAQAW
jgi:hypothetical protein